MLNIYYAPTQDSNRAQDSKPLKSGLIRPLQWRRILLHPPYASLVHHHHLCRRPLHRLPPRPHTLRTIPLVHRQRPIHRRQKRRTRPTRTPLRHRNERITPHPIGCIVRHIPSQRPITHASQRIKVRPRPLMPSTRILFNRRIPGRHDRRDRPALRPNRLPRRPKVQQHRRTIHIPQDDIARLDVPMQKIRPMHHL